MSEKTPSVIVPVPRPNLSDDDRERLTNLSLLVKGSGAEPLPSLQTVTLDLDYAVLQGDKRDAATFVLSLPAACQIIQQLQKAVDGCLGK